VIGWVVVIRLAKNRETAAVNTDGFGTDQKQFVTP
jgi:hypothetical protein